MRFVKKMAALVLAFGLAAPAVAGTLAGVSLPDSTEVDGRALVLNGLGLREATFLKVDVYVAGLYLESKSADAKSILGASGPKQLRMRFVRNLTRDEIVKAWREGVTKNASDQEPLVRDRFETLYAAMTDVAKGDEMILTEGADDSVAVSLGGKEIVRLKGRDFAKVLWSIWLGPHPPNPELKDGLLGKATD